MVLYSFVLHTNKLCTTSATGKYLPYIYVCMVITYNSRVLLLLLLFLTFSALVASPKKTTLHGGGQSRSWSAEQVDQPGKVANPARGQLNREN